MRSNEIIQDQAKRVKAAQAWLRHIWVYGAVYELRVLYARATYSTYFDDPDQLAQAALEADLRQINGELPQGIYCTVNPGVAELAARGLGELRWAGRGMLTTDSNIQARQVFLVDVDSIKPARGIGATEHELEQALELTIDVAKWLCEKHGWPRPSIANSGNGGHLVWLTDAPATDEAALDFKRALAALKRVWDADNRGSIDGAVFNASRIWKIPGTTARKGSNYIDREDPSRSRPWRVAQLIDLPVGAPALDYGAIIGLGERLKSEETSQAPAPRAARSSGSAWEEMLARALENLSWVDELVMCLDGGSYNDWIAVGGLIKEILGDDGAQLFETWSRSQPGYDGQEATSRKYHQLKAQNSFTQAVYNLLRLGRDKGWQLKEWSNRQRLGELRHRSEAQPPQRGAAPAPRPGDDGQVIQWTLDAATWQARQVGRMDRQLFKRLPHLHHSKAGIQYLDLKTQAGHYGPLALWECLTETDEGEAVAPLIRDGQLMRWDLELGIWQPSPIITGQAPQVCAQLQHSWHRRFIVSVAKQEGRAADTTSYTTGRPYGAQLLNLLEPWPDDTPMGVAFRDTWISIDPTSWTIRKVALRARHFAQARFDFDLEGALATDAPAPRWDAFLSGFFDEASEDHGDRVEYLKRWLALALFGMSTSAQAPALFLKGQKGCGKGELIKLLMALIPNVASVAPQAWDNEQMRGQLLGAQLNVYDDLSNAPIKDAATFKAIVFGGAVSYKIVYQATGTFAPRAAHLFTCNEMPTIPGADAATEDRVMILRVDGQSKRGTIHDVSEYHRVLLAEERDQIVADLYKALERWIEDRKAPSKGIERGFKIPSSSTDERSKRQGEDNAHNAWLREACIHDPRIPATDSITMTMAYRHFCAWATAAGYNHLGTRQTFKNRLEAQGIRLTKQRAGMTFEGLLVVLSAFSSSDRDYTEGAKGVAQAKAIALSHGLGDRLLELGIEDDPAIPF